MDQIRIRGGNRLSGEIPVSGAKNAALPLMAACLLTDGDLRLANMPDLMDIRTMSRLLEQHGVTVAADGNGTVGLGVPEITSTVAPYDLVRQMRASILVLGPLLARERTARVSLPGGCAIGARPVDLHLKGLEQLGADIEVREGYVHASVPGGLQGGRVTFPFVSVGATENLLMAATLAKGESVLENAAQEPEIADLAECLVSMGARIEGIGSNVLRVEGVDRLHGAAHSVVSDRIEAGTWAMAAAITDGELLITGTRPDILVAALGKLTEAGVEIVEKDNGLLARRAGEQIIGVDVLTEPYPGFPTDLQAQMMALMTLASGASMITEAIFENRFMHVPELARMGANINPQGSSAMVRGVPGLTGAPVMATDLRASVSLVLAGLAAKGETVINRVYHLDRGYENIEGKLTACGADIERVTAEPDHP